jgi:hypothetical protein
MVAQRNRGRVTFGNTESDSGWSLEDFDRGPCTVRVGRDAKRIVDPKPKVGPPYSGN